MVDRVLLAGLFISHGHAVASRTTARLVNDSDVTDEVRRATPAPTALDTRMLRIVLTPRDWVASGPFVVTDHHRRPQVISPLFVVKISAFRRHKPKMLLALCPPSSHSQEALGGFPTTRPPHLISPSSAHFTSLLLSSSAQAMLNLQVGAGIYARKCPPTYHQLA
jgi:hypothetical protein